MNLNQIFKVSIKIMSISLLILIIGFCLIFYSNANVTSNKYVSISKVELNKFKILGEVNVIRINKNRMSYRVVNKNHQNNNFYINANYFMKDNTPIGEVKINGKTVQKRNKGGGFFTSNGSNPTFYFKNRPLGVKFSVQTHTPIINNGTPNSIIFNKKWARSKLPRLIIGENKNRDIVVIHTINNTRCSVLDFYKIAKNQGLINALMLDGGASIEVGLNYKNINYNYQIISDVGRKMRNIPYPTVFIVGNFNDN